MGSLVPWPGIKPRPSALGAWSLNYWTTGEVPQMFFNTMFKIRAGCKRNFIEKRQLVMNGYDGQLLGSVKNAVIELVCFLTVTLSLSLLSLSSATFLLKQACAHTKLPPAKDNSFLLCSKFPLTAIVAFKLVSLSSDITWFLEILQDCQVVPSGDEFLLCENYNKHGNEAINCS